MLATFLANPGRAEARTIKRPYHATVLIKSWFSNVQIVSTARPQLRAARVACRASKLAGVDMAPADPILGVSEAFKKDDSPDKLNLGVGAYRTDDLQPCASYASFACAAHTTAFTAEHALSLTVYNPSLPATDASLILC